MAKIEDLISRISDEALRAAIASEIKELKKTKRFGLVFEEHLPETVRLPNVAIRKGSLVAKKAESGNACWVVREVQKGMAKCVAEGQPLLSQETVLIPLKELVAVKPFGEPIFPALTPIERVTRGGENKPWHMLINAENFHALQLLLYCYEGQVDVIYIDPPYNTGARDWKYNNAYVEDSDSFRHSKWLSMMKKRLLLAKRLLAEDGVLIIAIDDYEMCNLGVLVNDIFRDHNFEPVVINHHPQGAGGENISRTHEYACFVTRKGPQLVFGAESQSESETWSLQRSGASWKNFRTGFPNQFFAIHVDPASKAVVGMGPKLQVNDAYETSPTEQGFLRVYPIDGRGRERIWRYSHDSMVQKIAAGEIVCGTKKLTSLKVVKNRKGKFAPIFSNWTGSAFNAGTYGTAVIEEIFGSNDAFPYPKSLYTVKKCIEVATRKKKAPLILDFFAGSGTTLHACALANRIDGKKRRLILVTNNEVGETTATKLKAEGLLPGEDGWEAHGICESATWPRCKLALSGMNRAGGELGGFYLTTETKDEIIKLADGFAENMEYFRLDFLDPSDVERGGAFEGILPILWMMAGCVGEREDRRGATPFYIAKHSPFAVLIRENYFSDFAKNMEEREDITHVFLVTDSEENFAMMRGELRSSLKCHQLYKSYLENFRLNAADPSLTGQDSYPAIS